MLSPSLKANRSDPGLFGANGFSIKAMAQTSPWAGASCSPPAPPRSLSLNLAAAWYYGILLQSTHRYMLQYKCSICTWAPQISILKHLPKTLYAEGVCFSGLFQTRQVYSEWNYMVPEPVHWERLSSAHVLLPSHGLHASDKSSHSTKPFTVVIFVCLALRQTCNVQRNMCHMDSGTQEAEYTTCASQHL